MKHILKIVKYTSELWRYYAATGVLTVLISAVGLLQPLLSGLAIDEIRKGGGSRVGFVVFLAVAIFASDFMANVLNNINGYLGDRLSYKLNRLLAVRYYNHLLELPQHFYDTELTGKIISRLDRSVTQLSDYVNMLTNNFLQFIFGTIFALAVVAYYSLPVAGMLLLLYPIYVYMTTRTSGKWMAYQSEMNEHKDVAAGRFAEVINQIKVVKSFIQEKRELSYFDRRQKQIIATLLGLEKAEAVGMGDHHAGDQVELLDHGDTAAPVQQ